MIDGDLGDLGQRVERLEQNAKTVGCAIFFGLLGAFIAIMTIASALRDDVWK